MADDIGLSDEQFLERVYRFYLGRPADPSGRRHYLGRLAAGTPRRDIARELALSDEHLARVSEPGPAQDAVLSPFLAEATPGSPGSPLPPLSAIRDEYLRLTRGGQAGIDVPDDRLTTLMTTFRQYYGDLPFGEGEVPGLRFRYANGSFNHFDAVVLYCMLRHFAPRRVIEVGSGWSSALMLDVRERHFAGTLSLTFIDPDPARLETLMRDGDAQHCEILRTEVQDVDPERFEALERNDILFIDSSHVVRFGSDVVYLVGRVLPSLAPGVVVHVHDIFWNFEYPREWLLEGRAWSEAYLIRAFLAFNRAFEVLAFNDYFARSHWDMLEAHMPLCTTAAPGSPFRNAGVSLWLRRVG